MHAGWRAQDSASEPSTPRALGRRGKEPVLGDSKTGAQAQLLSSNCAKQSETASQEAQQVWPRTGTESSVWKGRLSCQPVAWTECSIEMRRGTGSGTGMQGLRRRLHLRAYRRRSACKGCGAASFCKTGESLPFHAPGRTEDGAAATPPWWVAGRRHPSIVPVGTRDTLTQMPTHGFGIVAICGLQR